MRDDFRSAIRTLAARRTVTVVSLLCLSLAIGANTAVFTVVNALLVRAVPLTRPERLVEVHETRADNPAGNGPVSFARADAWRAAASDVVELTAVRRMNVRVSAEGVTERHGAALVSPNFFTVLDVEPEHGRAFVAGDDEPDASVVIISYEMWRTRFGGDPDVVGRTIDVNGTPSAVVGVMPVSLAHHALPPAIRDPDLWIPLVPGRERARESPDVSVYGRLRDGGTVEQAATAIGTARSDMEGAPGGARAVSVRPLRVGFSATTDALLALAMGAVTFVLLMACANVANLTLARVMTQRRELALRRALGASRGRLVRHLFMSNLLVALASVPTGLAVALWVLAALLQRAGPDMRGLLAIDASVVAYSIALAVLASVLSGLLPMAHAVRRLKDDVLKAVSVGTTDTRAHARSSHAIVVVQVSLCLILLVGASLFIRSFRNALHADGGFDTEPVLTLRIDVSEALARDRRGLDALIERLGALPGVEAAAAATFLPLRDAGMRTTVVTDATAGSIEPRPVLVGGVTPGFFSAIGVPVVEGRMFSETDSRTSALVAVVNRAMARRLWPEGSAIGRRFRRTSDADPVWFTVVGVSADVLNWDLSNRPLPAFYVPLPHVDEREPQLFVRSAGGDSAALAPSVRQTMASAMPGVPVRGVSTMTDVHRGALSRAETLARLFTLLGGVALLLASAGVYAMLSHLVSVRTREIGIRAALGATRARLVRDVAASAATILAAGLVLGLAGGWALSRVVRGLHDVSPLDPFSFVAATVLLVATGLLATCLPARRAASVDPLVAIRE